FTRLVRLSYLAPEHHPSNPRWPPATRSDRRQTTGPLTSTACLARSANRARLCLSPISNLKPPPHRQCGGLAPASTALLEPIRTVTACPARLAYSARPGPCPIRFMTTPSSSTLRY